MSKAIQLLGLLRCLHKFLCKGEEEGEKEAVLASSVLLYDLFPFSLTIYVRPYSRSRKCEEAFERKKSRRRKDENHCYNFFLLK